MKKYKLLKDLPTFKAGDKFYLDNSGNLCAEDRQNTGFCKLIAYSKFTLDRFPTILADWFEEDNGEPWRAKVHETYYYIDSDGYIWGYTETHCSIDDGRYKIGNYFRSEEEAERAKAKLEAHATVKRDTTGFEADRSGDQLKYVVIYDSLVHKIKVTFCVHEYSIGQIYFATRDDAERSLANHEDEWRLLFDLDKEEE